MERLKTESITSLFLKYLIPSVTGTLSVGVLIFIDTVFIGRGVGSMGLAALNTAIPVFTLYSSTGLLLGMGGATAAAIDSGRGNIRGKNKIFSHAVILATGIGIIFTLLQGIFINGLTGILGATKTLFPMVKSYLGIISKFTLFYLVPHTLNAFIRNDGNPNLTMIGMVVCGIINIILDYVFIFIFGWGMAGAALATGLAQVAYFLILILHFYSPRNTLRIQRRKFQLETATRIFRIGFPSFLNDTSMGIAIFAFNLVLFRIRGDLAVSAYSIILNINFLVYLIFVGISQACQPLLSINYGAGNHDRVKETMKLGFLTSALVAVATIVLLNVFKYPIIRLFNREDMELIGMAAVGMPIFFSATLFMGLNIIYAILFQAVENPSVSSLLTFLRGLGLIIAGLTLLPNILGINGVWGTPLFAETITLITALIFYRRFKSKSANHN
ncbi:MATE family efflux transporter [Propionigenium maris DSM 9537]|uniref:Multidrug export protein MepA n=1 Tax=Propionigenium maris DSM 9537 TaxID=1123000 RepID=A0A9W6GNB0_9FUSO|nr:MATE family efflux transporter [Propionigenium maris]GLI56841.1 MATE family efflux transporter [Propionigenium maris DSM 9537]